MTLSDVEQALNESRELDSLLIVEGWNVLEVEENYQIVDLYPTIQSPSIDSDPEARITIKLQDEQYQVPLEDVSDIHVNDVLVITKEDLYIDWRDRILSKLGEPIDIVNSVEITDHNGETWNRYTYLSPDDNIRITWERVC